MILGGGKVEVRETAVPDHLLPLLRAELDLGLKVNSYILDETSPSLRWEKKRDTKGATWRRKEKEEKA